MIIHLYVRLCVHHKNTYIRPMCMCARVHVCVCVFNCARMHVCVCDVFVYVCVYEMCLCVCVCVCVRARARVRACIHTCMCVCVCVCMCDLFITIHNIMEQFVASGYLVGQQGLNCSRTTPCVQHASKVCDASGIGTCVCDTHFLLQPDGTCGTYVL